jgi:putative transposase
MLVRQQRLYLRMVQKLAHELRKHLANGIAISMDGKGAWRDNVFVERLWRSVKYEEVYLRAYEPVSDARASIGRYLDFYNGRRPHSSLDGATPDKAYFTPLPLRLAA